LGVASFYVGWFSKKVLRVDDALDVIAIHGTTGIIGMKWKSFIDKG
jgi:ammonia channel protein AmtB